MGIGLILACAPGDEDAVRRALTEAGEQDAPRIGVIHAGGEGVRYE
jgi:phosphoribosylaminoimidazole (AIR) synthetase